MRAVVYTEHGGAEVLRLVERDVPEPGPGELLVRVHVSGVNPTDWKSRRGSGTVTPSSSEVEQVPNQDGAGVVTAVGPGVDADRIGQRVWLWEAAWQRRGGTAQEYLALPERQAVPLPDDASLDLGAALGIPALTAHRCLTVAEGGPPRLAPGVLAGRRVLVTGGAGAVGNAAIQLARWAGADVLTTVSTPEKARLATAAGAQHVVDYRAPDAVDQLREAAPDGIHLVVDVSVAANLPMDLAVLVPGGTVAGYAADAGTEAKLGVRELMVHNTRLQFVLVYTVPAAAKERAVADVAAAVADGALRVGESAGLPLHRFPLERCADAHAAVEKSAIGKVLIDVVDRE